MKKNLQEGFIKKNPGILTDIRKRLTEDGDTNSTDILSKEIARLSFLIGTRLEVAKDMGKQIRLSSALTLLTQAQLLTSTDKKEARKLYNSARRLGK